MNTAQRRTFGAMPAKKPEGALVAVRFPTLALAGVRTPDGRLLEADAGGTRPLPAPIQMQDKKSYGHDGAVVSGALYEVTYEEDGNISGRGFLIDTPAGQMHALYIKSGAMRGNSVDLADTKVIYEFNPDANEETVKFTGFNIGATTGVTIPAFPTASIELDDEFVASLAGDDVELVADGEWWINVLAADGPDLTASAGTLVQPHEAFFVPEPDDPTPITIDADGNVFGHLGLWGQCHTGIEGRCVVIPRPQDGYSTFMKPNAVLTDKGSVSTGPIFALGGHAYGADLEQAYGGIENAWADVRVIEGRLGPWISGRVRPGVPDEVVYAARASKISGHWKAGVFRAIVSVNVEGFPVTGEHAAVPSGFAFDLDERGEVLNLVASFPPCAMPADEDPDYAELTDYIAEISDVDPDDEFAVSVDRTPTTPMAEAAREGLSWRREFKRGGSNVSVARARDISAQKQLSVATLKRMVAFFGRNTGGGSNRTGWKVGDEGFPSAHRVLHALWGGNEAMAWATQKLAEINQAKADASTQADSAHAAAVVAAALVLDDGDDEI